MQPEIILIGISKAELLEEITAIVRAEIEAMPKPEKIKLYMNVDDLSEFINESKQTIYTRTYKKEIPFIKRGGKLLFKRTDIIHWLDSNRITPRVESIVGAMDRT